MLSQLPMMRSNTSCMEVVLDTNVTESPCVPCGTLQMDDEIEFGIQSGKNWARGGIRGIRILQIRNNSSS